ncbi:MAG: sigma-70 family RNA polymerase sigma factor [Magnetococcales bacterium]|nr:sigma-70 family RNA polymerase sigma factor [Magnetococcales bacterium]
MPRNKNTDDDALRADALIMTRVAANDATAWRQVVDRQLGRVLLLAKRMLGQHQEAEEVAQEAFIRLWRQSSCWTGEARIGTWLFRVVHNLCIDRLRAYQRRMEEGAWIDEEIASLPAPSSASPLALYEQSERRKILDQALALLPLRQRTALVLVNMLGLHVGEAASVMHIGEEAMASLLARGREGLRQRLAPWHDALVGNGHDGP